MNALTFAPALGWIAGPIVAIALVATATAYAVWFARHRADTDAGVSDVVRRTLAAVTLAAMTMTPGIPATVTSRAVNATDVFVAVDVTGSMAVSDAAYGPSGTVSRLDAARAAVGDIVGLYPDASFAGVSFGVAGSLDVPPTPDGRALTSWADTLQAESTSTSAGSNLDAPIDRLLTSLKATRDRHPDDAIILYLITDGEQTSDRTRRTYSSLRAYLDDAIVVGVGSTEGGRVPRTADGVQGAGNADGAGNDWVIDPATGQPGISRMDEGNLKAMADEMSGSYEHVDASHTISNGSSAAKSGEYRLTVADKERTRIQPLTWPFAIALVALIAWEAASWTARSRRLL